MVLDVPNDDSASGVGRGRSISEAEKAPRSQEWADDSVRGGGFMTSRKTYRPDGMADVSVGSRYSDKEHLPSFRTDVGAGDAERSFIFFPCSHAVRHKASVCSHGAAAQR